VGNARGKLGRKSNQRDDCCASTLADWKWHGSFTRLMNLPPASSSVGDKVGKVGKVRLLRLSIGFGVPDGTPSLHH
jgi:hypothetical protein